MSSTYANHDHTFDRRIETAERLREYGRDTLLDGSLLKTLKDVTGADSWRHVLLDLADLIDPTCTYEPTETLNYWDAEDSEHETNKPGIECGSFSCSRCGNEMLYGEDVGWFDTEPPYAPHFMVCPECGSRVLPMIMRDRVVDDGRK